jgi:hypothetical protein
MDVEWIGGLGFILPPLVLLWGPIAIMYAIGTAALPFFRLYERVTGEQLEWLK